MADTEIEVIAQVADEYSIPVETARKILHFYSEQLVPPTPTPALEPERPPARKVDPFWILNTAWQILEPTIAWPLGVYNMAKMGMAAYSGLSAAAALPKKLGGMSARELWTTSKNPAKAAEFQKFYSRPKSQRVKALRPSIKPSSPPTKPGGRWIGGWSSKLPPTMTGVASWMPAAGIIGSVAAAILPGPRDPDPKTGKCPKDYHRCVIRGAGGKLVSSCCPDKDPLNLSGEYL